MRKPIVNYLLDWSAFLFLMPMIATGAILYFRLPPGSGTDSMLGLTRHEWGSVHSWVAAALLVVVVVHLILHAAWIKTLTLGNGDEASKRRRAWAAAGLAGILLALAVFVAVAPVAPGSRDGEGRGARANRAEHSGPGQRP
jgi:hypothetical protein